MKNKYLVFSIFGVGLLSLGSFSFAFSLFKKVGSPVSIEISGSTIVKKTITVYLPDSTDTTEYKNFVSSTIEVDEGSNLYTALTSKTGDINNFSFVSWHASSDHFRNDDTTQDKYETTYTVTEDMTVYAKYVMPNTLYYYHTVDKKDYYVTTSHTDYGMNAKEVYYGDRIYSNSGVEGHKIDLHTDTGIYNLTRDDANNKWTAARKVTFSATNVTWWPSGAHTHIYLERTDGTSEWLTDISWSSNKYAAYIDATYNKIVITRSPNASHGWDNLYNQTVDAFVTNKGKGTEVYSKDHTTFYIEDEKVDNKNKYSWY